MLWVNAEKMGAVKPWYGTTFLTAVCDSMSKVMVNQNTVNFLYS